MGKKKDYGGAKVEKKGVVSAVSCLLWCLVSLCAVDLLLALVLSAWVIIQVPTIFVVALAFVSGEFMKRQQQIQHIYDGGHNRNFGPFPRTLIDIFLLGISPLYVAPYVPPANDEAFFEDGCRLIKRGVGGRSLLRLPLRNFKAYFGATPKICADIWQMINPPQHINQYARPVHLLWGLMLMKVYATEEILSGIAGVTEKTYRKWAWKFVISVSNLSYSLVS
jgi:hypothetical protein